MFGKDDIIDRATGAWWGQLTGDALGSQVEFSSPEDIRRQWPNGLRHMEASRVWHTLPGQPTDDSEMAMALGQALMMSDPGRPDWDRVALAYKAWYESGPFDMGGTISCAVSGPVDGPQGPAEIMRRRADRQKPTNGALMRQSMLAIWGCYLDEETVARYARQDAELTHPHPVCQEASAVYVASIAQAIRWGLDAKQVYRYAVRFQERFGREETVMDALRRAEDVEPPYSPRRGYVLTALHNAFYRLLHSPSMEGAIVDTVSLGGDTDTNAAIAGALAGAVYGAEAVPADWRKTVLGCEPTVENGAHRPRPVEYWPQRSLSLIMPKRERAFQDEWDWEIPTVHLTLADIPPSESPWVVIATFALSFPWDDESRPSSNPVFREIAQRYQDKGTFPEDIVLLRMCLYRLQRSIRWNEQSIRDWDDDPAIRYARALVDAIRAQVAVRTRRS